MAVTVGLSSSKVPHKASAVQVLTCIILWIGYRIFYIYSEDSNAVSLMTIWNIQHFPVNFLGIGIQTHEQSCQNTTLFLLSKCETPIEIAWLLSINLHFSWSNPRRNTQGKVPQRYEHEKLNNKNILLALSETLVYISGQYWIYIFTSKLSYRIIVVWYLRKHRNRICLDYSWWMKQIPLRYLCTKDKVNKNL